MYSESITWMLLFNSWLNHYHFNFEKANILSEDIYTVLESEFYSSVYQLLHMTVIVNIDIES